MRIACWVTKTTNTQLGYILLTALPLQKHLHEHASILLETFFACLVTVHCDTLTCTKHQCLVIILLLIFYPLIHCVCCHCLCCCCILTCLLFFTFSVASSLTLFRSEFCFTVWLTGSKILMDFILI